MPRESCTRHGRKRRGPGTPRRRRWRRSGAPRPPAAPRRSQGSAPRGLPRSSHTTHFLPVHFTNNASSIQGRTVRPPCPPGIRCLPAHSARRRCGARRSARPSRPARAPPQRGGPATSQGSRTVPRTEFSANCFSNSLRHSVSIHALKPTERFRLSAAHVQAARRSPRRLPASTGRLWAGATEGQRPQQSRAGSEICIGRLGAAGAVPWHCHAWPSAANVNCE